MNVKVYDWLAQHAATRPNRTALINLQTDESFTYKEVERRVSRFARALRERCDVGRSDRVAVLSGNHCNCLEIEFACMKLGAVYVPLNWRLTAAEMEYIVEDAQPKVLIFEEAFARTASELKARCDFPFAIHFDGTDRDNEYERLIEEFDPLPVCCDVSSDDVWTIMYTSGTTGQPKGAMLTYGMTMWNVFNLLTPHRLSEDMVNLCILPLFHTGGLNVYANPAVYLGATNLILPAFSASEVLDILSDREIGVTHTIGVPTNWLMMSQEESFTRADLSGLRTCCVGGAPVTLQLLKSYQAQGVTLMQMYGMTETGPIVSTLTAEAAERKVGSAGRPVLNVDVRVVDPQGTDVAGADEVGELWVKGPIVTPGYWKAEARNHEYFTEGWFHTGDAAYSDEEGYLYIVDRWKDMYISGGENVYPAEVEKVIYQLQEVLEVAVVGIADEKWGEVGCACIVLKPGRELSQADIQKHCAGRLARFKQPKYLKFLDELPHNATGKILKKNLDRSLLVGSGSTTGAVQP